jgi:hypothetical protein
MESKEPDRGMYSRALLDKTIPHVDCISLGPNEFLISSMHGFTFLVTIYGWPFFFGKYRLKLYLPTVLCPNKFNR